MQSDPPNAAPAASFNPESGQLRYALALHWLNVFCAVNLPFAVRTSD
jgi:hypothetical protein